MGFDGNSSNLESLWLCLQDPHVELLRHAVELAANVFVAFKTVRPAADFGDVTDAEAGDQCIERISGESVSPTPRAPVRSDIVTSRPTDNNSPRRRVKAWVTSAEGVGGHKMATVAAWAGPVHTRNVARQSARRRRFNGPGSRGE